MGKGQINFHSTVSVLGIQENGDKLQSDALKLTFLYLFIYFYSTSLMFFCFCRPVHVWTGTTATSTLRPVTCWTLFSMRIPAQARAQPPRGLWAQAPTAVGLQLAGHPTAERLRAGHQPVGPPAVEQVCFVAVKSSGNKQEK